MANAAPQLQEAYDLIESGDLQSARQLLEDIQPDYDNNPDYWWVYAHAIENEQDGLVAIERVRQLAPNYPGLSTLSEQLGISSLQTMSASYGSPLPDAPSTADVEDYYDDDDFESIRSRSNPLVPLGIFAVILVVVLLVGFSALSNLFGGGTGDEQPTQDIIVAENSPAPIIGTINVQPIVTDVEATADPSLEPIGEEATDTDEPITEEPTDEPSQTPEPPTDEPSDTPEPSETPVPVDPFETVYSDLSAFGVPEDGITTGTTNTFGDTYIVSTCSSLGPVATQNILGIVDSLASVADSLDDTVAGFAFEITDCSTDNVQLVLGIDRATADNYWSGIIDQTDLQRALERVN